MVARAGVDAPGVTLVALFVFRLVESRFIGMAPIRGGLRTLVTGGLAVAAAFGFARIFA